MMVTLERVQYKFASIIGELCSEPHILSQFAVWVDLRLAEYKSKGFISLDCSGDKPDPSWLKGLTETLVVTADELRENTHTPPSGASSDSSRISRETTTYMSTSVDINSNQNFLQTDSGSSDILESNETNLTEDFDKSSNSVIPGSWESQSFLLPDVSIKEEADDSIFPVTLHMHSNHDNRIGESHSNFPNRRKRSTVVTQLENASISTAHSFHGRHDNSATVTPMKLRRIMPTKSNSMPLAESSNNQTLLSILRTNNNESSVDMNVMNDQSSYSLKESVGTDASILVQTPFLSSAFPSTSTPAATSSSDSVTFGREVEPLHLGDSQHALGTSSVGTDEIHVILDSGTSCSAETYSWNASQRLHGISTMSTSLLTMVKNMATPTRKAKRHGQSLLNTRSAAKMVQMWISTLTMNSDRRLLEEMPPQELDSYLAQFFAQVKTKYGDDYNPNSFITIRKCVGQHLVDANYPYSIAKSPEFMRSQISYKGRLTELRVKFERSKKKGTYDQI